MFSDRTTRELEEALENERSCKLEIQRPNGRTFTVYLEQGRAQQIEGRQEYQQDQSSQEGQRSPQQGRQVQEWKVRKIAQPGQQQN